MVGMSSVLRRLKAPKSSLKSCHKRHKVSPAKAQRRKALQRLSRVFFAPLRLCGRNSFSLSLLPKGIGAEEVFFEVGDGIVKCLARIAWFKAQLASSFRTV